MSDTAGGIGMSEPNRHFTYEFGEFRVDVRKRQIFKHHRALPLTAKAFDTLAVLLAANGETISKATLMDAVWPETAVEENNLTQQISALRKAFDERAGDHKFIVTVPGRGYCFVAEVRKLASHESVEPRHSSIASRTAFAAAPTAETAGWSGYALAVGYVLV